MRLYTCWNKSLWARSVATGALVFAAACEDCGSGSEASEEPSTEAPEAEETPEIQVQIEPLPETVEFDEEKAMLGRLLYHDPILSGDGTVACATCHSLDSGGAEPRRTSVGMNGAVGPINSPTVLNSRYNIAQFWDGRAATLEEQAAGPVANPIEMGANWDEVVAQVQADERYAELFAAAYEDGITQDNITHAIAEYERSLVTPSPFDAYLRGDEDALTAEQLEGWRTFAEVGCQACHRGINVGGGLYQKLGLIQNYFEDRGTEITDADLGRFNVTGEESDRHFFKVPTLRNVALTAPYLHDGSQETLHDVVRVMGHYQLGRDLTDEQVDSIVAFLGALTGELPDHARLPEDEVIPDRTAAAAATGDRDGDGEGV